MKKDKKALIVLVSINIVFVFFIFTCRPVPRLLIWNIKEIKDVHFFYPAGNESAWMHFEQQTPEIKKMKDDVRDRIPADIPDSQKMIKYK